MDRATGSSVYFIVAQPSYRVKIGRAAYPEKRLKQLQIANPEKLRLLGTIWREDSVKADRLEKHLHSKLKHVRTENGEWFAPEPELFAILRKLSIPLPFDTCLHSVCPPYTPDLLAYDKAVAKNACEMLLAGCSPHDEAEEKEAREYFEHTATEFNQSGIGPDYKFHIGSACYTTRHILYLAWRGAELLCRGRDGNRIALWFLEQSVAELKKVVSEDEFHAQKTT